MPESRRDPADLPTCRAVTLLQPPLTGAAASAGAKRAYVEIAAEAVRELEPVAAQRELQFYKTSSRTSPRGSRARGITGW